MPAHPGGEVVQREQVGQRGRVGRLLLQRVDQPQLPLQQRLVPPGQADEDLAEAVAQPGLAGGRRDGGLLQAGRWPRAAWAISALRVRGQDGPSCGQPGVLAVPQPLHGLRQLLVRQPPGGRGQVGDIPGQLAGEAAHQNDRADEDDQAAPAEQDHLDDLRGGSGGQVVVQAGAEHHAASAQSTTRQVTGIATVAMKVNRIDRRAGRGCCGPAELDTPIWSLLDRSAETRHCRPDATVGDPSCAITHPLSSRFTELPGR